MADKKTAIATDVTTGIDVTISEAQRTKLCAMAPAVRPTEAISGIATGLLQDLADGGMMLNGRVVARLAAIMNGRDFDGPDLVSMAEKGAKRFGQAELVEYAIDPIYRTPLADWSRSNGRTVQELVQDCMTICFENEYFYSLNFEHRTLSLTVEDYRKLADIIGKEVIFGADVVEFVRAYSEAPELVGAK